MCLKIRYDGWIFFEWGTKQGLSSTEGPGQKKIDLGYRRIFVFIW